MMKGLLSAMKLFSPFYLGYCAKCRSNSYHFLLKITPCDVMLYSLLGGHKQMLLVLGEHDDGSQHRLISVFFEEYLCIFPLFLEQEVLQAYAPYLCF